VGHAAGVKPALGSIVTAATVVSVAAAKAASPNCLGGRGASDRKVSARQPSSGHGGLVAGLSYVDAVGLAGVSDDDVEFRQHRFQPPPGACEVLLVRHGESQPVRLDQPPPMVAGQADPPLDPRGRAEAHRLADRLRAVQPAAIHVSTLRRTAETAAPLAQRLGKPSQVTPELSEIHLGDWEGAEWRRRVHNHDPVAMRAFAEQRWDVIPGAESNEAVADRLRAGLGRIAAAHPDQRVVVVSHAGAIGVIVALATGANAFAFIGADNASISHLVVAGDTWVVRRFNDTAHLATDLDHPPD
jgi:probable phosphoglycerate mutase